MLTIKVILYIFIFITSTLIGYIYGGIYSKRVYSLIDLQQGIRFLQAEITIFANPLPIALKNASDRVSGDISKVFQIILENLMENELGDVYFSFLEASSYLKERCSLSRDDIDLFTSLGKVIGKTNREDQERQFTYVLEELDLHLFEAREAKNKNEKLYRSLGVLLGLGIIIILI